MRETRTGQQVAQLHDRYMMMMSQIQYMGVAKYMQVNIYYRKHRGKKWNPTIYIMINKEIF